MFSLIKELTELSGPVGQEDAVLDRVEALWREGGAAVERTRIGNVLARAGGQGPKVLQRVPRQELKCDLTLACTVQEEIGLTGAFALAASERFDAAVVLEVGLAGDIPGVKERAMPLRLGAGPVLVHKDMLVHYDHALTMQLEQVAQAADIPIQHAVFGSFASDGSALMKAGIPAALLAFPVRYTHTPFETAHLDDIEALVRWLCAFVQAGINN